jgi:hypothetical protein
MRRHERTLGIKQLSISSLVRCLAILVSLLESRSVAAVEVSTSNHIDAVPTQNHEPSRRLRGLIGVSIVRSTYAWKNAQPGESLYQLGSDGMYTNTRYSKFSPGFGFDLKLGCVVRQVLPNFSVRTALEYQRIGYSTDYPYYNGAPDLLSHARLRLLQIGTRAIWDHWHLKPYLEIAPGLAYLVLPNQEIRWNPSTGIINGSVEPWKSGVTVSGSIGVLYEVLPSLLLDVNVGYRRDTFTRTNERDTSPYSDVCQAFVMSLALEWWP